MITIAALALALTPVPLAGCEEAVARLTRAAGSDTRVVVSFTGSQNSLSQLDSASDPRAEPSLFPVSPDLFVFTLNLRPYQISGFDAEAFARRTCSLERSKGARFNGVMSFKRESMTKDGRTLFRENMIDAVMAEFQSK
ncbi:hypothetical protein [Sphingomonas sp.]|jgi:hypothetical protein|uniref:hypothetical protein n=1 Tax=Sphingomonas sp. TaxID=28214 RepID=UPI002ED91E79